MTTIIASSPGKIILFGEHGVNRRQPALSTAVDMRLYCRVTLREKPGYAFHSAERQESGSVDRLLAFKTQIDELRRKEDLDTIRERARDFFAPPRYVLAHVVAAHEPQALGFDVTWRSPLPVGAGMGSGAAASTAMVKAVMQAAGGSISPSELAHLGWQGDAIAHGGISSSLDSSTCAHGGLIRYTVADGAQPLSLSAALPLVIGDTLVQTTTAELNTRVRKLLEEHPARMHLFEDMGYLVQQAIEALGTDDLPALGRLMNLHQLLQEKILTSCAEAEQLIEAAIGAGALGAKISGAGGGGIIMALAEPQRQEAVARAIDAAGGRSYIVTSGAEGTRIEPQEAWASAQSSTQKQET